MGPHGGYAIINSQWMCVFCSAAHPTYSSLLAVAFYIQAVSKTLAVRNIKKGVVMNGCKNSAMVIVQGRKNQVRRVNQPGQQDLYMIFASIGRNRVQTRLFKTGTASRRVASVDSR